MATTINKTLRKFAKENNHRLIGFLVESERKTTLQFEGCVRVEDAAKVIELLNEIIKISAKAKERDRVCNGVAPEEA